MENCDPFRIVDRDWSEMNGFHEIVDGRNFEFPDRPRTFFHVVSDTDEGMCEAISRGEGLKRRLPHGRFDFQVGDRVMVFNNFSPYVESVSKMDEKSERPIFVFNKWYFLGGKEYEMSGIPFIMRLYGGEYLFENPLENLRWVLDEAIKEGWYEKYVNK